MPKHFDYRFNGTSIDCPLTDLLYSPPPSNKRRGSLGSEPTDYMILFGAREYRIFYGGLGKLNWAKYQGRQVTITTNPQIPVRA